MIITILRWYFKILLRLYYREIVIEGIDYIKEGTPQLLIANHKNSLVDGLLFITQIDKNVIMTTTSKLKKFPLADKILRRANVQIFYRRIDGYSNDILKKNVSSIDRSADLLAENNHVLIFPEGLTTEDGYMRPFKTGFARIAKSYLERYDRELEIVPIYINYTDRKKIRSEISMDILPPVSGRELQEKYPEDFINQTIEDIQARLKEVEKQKILEAEDEKPEPYRYLDRVLALPVLLFHFLPSALVILIGDKINPKEETKATTRIFLSVFIFPVVFFFQLTFLISLLPLIWFYFLVSYGVVYIYHYTKSRIDRRKSNDKLIYQD